MSGQPSFVQQAPVHPETSARFGDLHPPLDRQAAIPEANRCLYCFDAPCTTACPTHIDVPRFIKKIASGNLAGSARTILDANILGASCARACPVEVLCEGACVMHRYNKQPIQIARLQRFAMDSFYASGAPLPFTPARKPAVRWRSSAPGRRRSPALPNFAAAASAPPSYDARPLPGGLNTYGVAEYKLPLVESLREIEMLSQLGVEFHFDTIIDAQRLADLEARTRRRLPGNWAGRDPSLGIAGEDLPGVTNALDLIAGYKSGRSRRCRRGWLSSARATRPSMPPLPRFGWERGCAHRLSPRRGADVGLRLRIRAREDRGSEVPVAYAAQPHPWRRASRSGSSITER